MARGKYKGPKRGSGQRNRDRQEDEEEDAFRAQAGAGQAATAGMMPPSSSDDDEEDEEAQPTQRNPGLPYARMGAPGELPPNSDSDEDDSSDEDDDSDIEPHGMKTASAPPRRKKDDDVDPAQVAKDLERLKLVREKREKERQERIATEGWDRYAPISDTNQPPDARPSDHPDFRK